MPFYQYKAQVELFCDDPTGLTSVMFADTVSHFVFVDFENVPNADLDAIGALPVVVTLLIGKSQTKLDTSLVAQIHRHAAKVRLVEVGASGRNALDLTLAYYLGRARVEAAEAELHIVSRDKDFEPLIAHLRSQKVKISRAESFAALPFLPAKKSAPHHKKTASTQKKPVAVESSVAPIDKFEKLISRLTNSAAPRPKRKKGLLSHINTAYGNKLSETELLEKLDQLAARAVCKIDSNDRVTY